MAIYYVDLDSGSNGNSGTSSGDAWLTRQYALDNITPDTYGDIVYVTGSAAQAAADDFSTYAPSATRHLYFVSDSTVFGTGRALLTGVSGSVLDSTTVDGVHYDGFEFAGSTSNKFIIKMDNFGSVTNCKIDLTGLALPRAFDGDTNFFAVGNDVTAVRTSNTQVDLMGCATGHFIGNTFRMSDTVVAGTTQFRGGFFGSGNSSYQNNLVIVDSCTTGIQCWTSNHDNCIFTGNRFVYTGGTIPTPASGVFTAIRCSTSTHEHWGIYNNYFEGFVDCIDSGSAIIPHCSDNRYFNCTNFFTDYGGTAEILYQARNTELSVSGIVDLASADYRLRNSVMGGTGLPSTMPEYDGAIQSAYAGGNDVKIPIQYNPIR